ncbi:hypothetical protein ACMDB5_00805 [Flavobacterium sp. W1B]|uniref:hypothetical protein n=1 Tax=Flavobacterium sp. W1B TaxID=3394146 RepID=UPI0039BD898B
MTSEIKTLEEFKHFASYHFDVLTPAENIYAGHILEIKVSGYSDMIRLGCNLIKMCAYITQSDGPYITDLVKDPHIDVSSVLELALQLFPHGELEVLDEVYQLLIDDEVNKTKKNIEKE